MNETKMNELQMPNDELMHYGVLGMKWGIKHNPTKAYHKALNKSNKLKKKSDKYILKSDKTGFKAAKYKRKAFKKRTGWFPNNEKAYKYESKQLKYEVKSNKLKYKSEKAKQKREKWLKRVHEEFSDYKVTRIPKESVRVGLHYVDAYEVTPLSEVKKKVG